MIFHPPPLFMFQPLNFWGVGLSFGEYLEKKRLSGVCMFVCVCVVDIILGVQPKTRWWLEIFVYVHPEPWRRQTPNLTHIIFQGGWIHQPVMNHHDPLRIPLTRPLNGIFKWVGFHHQLEKDCLDLKVPRVSYLRSSSIPGKIWMLWSPTMNLE